MASSRVALIRGQDRYSNITHALEAIDVRRVRLDAFRGTAADPQRHPAVSIL